MGESNIAELKFSSNEVHLGTCLSSSGRGAFHVGVVYRNADDELAAIHLGWEDSVFTSRQFPSIIVESNLHPYTQRGIATFFENMADIYAKRESPPENPAKATVRLPYGITYNGGRFEVDGSLALGPGSLGLSCATFVLAVYKSMNVELVDESTWPVRPKDDAAFVMRLREIFSSNNKKHMRVIERIESEISSGCKRIQPAEVFIASGMTPPPAAKFDQVAPQVPLVEAVLNHLISVKQSALLLSLPRIV